MPEEMEDSQRKEETAFPHRHFTQDKHGWEDKSDIIDISAPNEALETDPVIRHDKCS